MQNKSLSADRLFLDRETGTTQKVAVYVKL